MPSEVFSLEEEQAWQSDFKKNVQDVVLAVLPITLMVILLQVFLVSLPWEEFDRFPVGAAMVLLGVLLFPRSSPATARGSGKKDALGHFN